MKAELGMLEFIAITLIMVGCGITFGIFMGSASNAIDCEALGKFRVNKTVYVCRPESTKQPKETGHDQSAD